MRGLTTKQQQVLDVIRTATRRDGQAPTVREIGTALGVSSSCTVTRHLDALERKGYVARDRYKYRSVRLTGPGAGVPCCVRCEEPVRGQPVRDDRERLWCRDCAADALAEVRLEPARVAA